MTAITLTRGDALERFARNLVRNLGADEARARTTGPAREAVERAIMLMQAVDHEREEFAAWCMSIPGFTATALKLGGDGKYLNESVECAWQGWLARSRWGPF